MQTSVLRSPTKLESTFYNELLAPLLFFASSRSDRLWKLHSRLMAQRFKKDIARYGYVLTETGLMVNVEPDILDLELDPGCRTMVASDMKLLDRLTRRSM